MAIEWIYNRNPPYWRHVRVLLDDGTQCHAYLGDPKMYAGEWYNAEKKPLQRVVKAWVIDPVHEKRLEIAEAERRLEAAREELKARIKLYGDFA